MSRQRVDSCGRTHPLGCRCVAPRPLVSALALTVLAVSPALGQAPGSLSPGLQLQQQLQTPTAAPTPLPDRPLLPEEKPAAEPGEPGDLQPVPAGSPQARIQLGEVSFRGIVDHGYRPANLPRIFQQLRTRFTAMAARTDLTCGDLQQASIEANRELSRQGYITSLVKPVARGTTTLSQASCNQAGSVIDVTIVASFIETTVLEGRNDALVAYVRKMLQPLVGGTKPKIVFNQLDLERQLLLMRNFGAVEVTPVLQRGRLFGGTVLTASVEAIRPKASLQSDNNVPLQLGTWRLGATAEGYVPSVQPVFLSASGNNAFSIPGGFADGFVQARTPLGNQGWQTDLLWGTTTTSSKDLVAGPNIGQTGGTSNLWSVGASYPLLLRRYSMLSVGLKGTLQNSTNDYFFNGEHIADLNTDKIRAIRLTLDGYTQSPPTATKPGSISQVGVILSQGFSGLGSALAAGEVPSNLYGDASFTTARFNLSHTRELLRNSTGTSVTLATLKGTAQLSGSGVPVPEQFTYGGPYYGRAFNSVYILGDEGWAGSFELGQRFLVNSGRQTLSLMPFAWYDYGYTSYREGSWPLQNNSAGTYGIGARGSVLGGISSFELGWGIPSSNTIQASRIGASNSIVYFKMRVGF